MATEPQPNGYHQEMPENPEKSRCQRSTDPIDHRRFASSYPLEAFCFVFVALLSATLLLLTCCCCCVCCSLPLFRPIIWFYTFYAPTSNRPSGICSKVYRYQAQTITTTTTTMTEPGGKRKQFGCRHRSRTASHIR